LYYTSGIFPKRFPSNIPYAFIPSLYKPCPSACNYPNNTFLFLLSYLLHGVEHSREDDRFSASQEIPDILWKPNVHYCILKCRPLVPILNQVYLASTSHFVKIHLNIILPSTPLSFKWSFTSGFDTKPLYTHLLSPF